MELINHGSEIALIIFDMVTKGLWTSSISGPAFSLLHLFIYLYHFPNQSLNIVTAIFLYLTMFLITVLYRELLHIDRISWTYRR